MHHLTGGDRETQLEARRWPSGPRRDGLGLRVTLERRHRAQPGRSPLETNSIGAPFLTVTPHGAALPLQPNASGRYAFTVSYWNPFSSNPVAFGLVCSSAGNITCTGLSQTTVNLAPNQSATVSASYAFSSGTGRLVLTACGGGPGGPFGPCLGASWMDSGWVTINPPPTVAITGPTSISSPGTYTWVATATGGDGTYGYQWSYQPQGSSSWFALGTAATQARYVSSSTPPFTLQVVVISAAQTASASLYVDNSMWQPPCTRQPCPQ